MDDGQDLDIPLRLVRLTSSLLPVGSFAYSRGLEHAAQSGLVGDGDDLRSWVFGTMEHSFARLDGPVFLRMMAALSDNRLDDFRDLDALLLAARESRELRLEDLRMAEAMLTLLRDLEVGLPSGPTPLYHTFAAAYAIAVLDLDVPAEAGLRGLMWSVCEAQIAAGIRLGVIGQARGQSILSDAPEAIGRWAEIAKGTEDDDIGNLSFMVALGSALHETQYSRLFRS